MELILKSIIGIFMLYKILMQKLILMKNNLLRFIVMILATFSLLVLTNSIVASQTDPQNFSLLRFATGSGANAVIARKTNSGSYPNITATLISSTAEDAVRYNVAWFKKASNDSEFVQEGSVEITDFAPAVTKYGIWTFGRNSNFWSIPGCGNTGQTYTCHVSTNFESYIFAPNATNVNALESGATAKIELTLHGPNPNQTGTNTIFIYPNAEFNWENSTSNSKYIDLDRNSSIETQIATLETYNTDSIATLLNSRVTIDSNTPTIRNLVLREIEPSWTGLEWVADTGYGNWIIGNVSNLELGERRFNVKFVPTDSAFMNATFETLKLEVIYETRENFRASDTRILTLTIVLQDTEIEWNLTSTGIQSGGDSNIDFPNQVGKITTFASDLSNLNFKSQLFDNNTTPVEATLTQMEVQSDWPGMEWTTATTYGEWVVGNQVTGTTLTTDCDNGATCFAVLFKPNDTNLNAVSGQNLKINLQVIKTENSVVKETDTLTYQFKGHRQISPMDGIGTTNEILQVSDATSYASISGNVSIFKSKTEIISVEAQEKSNRTSQTSTPVIGMESSGTNEDSGFTSKEYGTNLSFGSWYFSTTDSESTDDTVDDNFQTITRQISFIPNKGGILAMSVGDLHESSLTIKVTNSDGTETLSTHKITVNISYYDYPLISIATETSDTVTEGQTATIKLESSRDPNNEMPIKVFYSIENTTGDFFTIAGDETKVAQTTDLTFTQNMLTDPWSVDLPITLRAKDSMDTDNGAITVRLEQPDLSQTNAVNYSVSAVNGSKSITIEDDDVPEISIEDAPETRAGFDAEFILTANFKPLAPLVIKYAPENMTEEFLNVSGGASAANRTSDPIEFKQIGDSTDWTGTLEIPTKDDTTAASGEIKVTLKADDINTPAKYTISATEADYTATVDVVDIPTPILSIADITTPVTEGNMVKFMVSADADPRGRRTIPVNFTPTVTGTNFLDTTRTDKMTSGTEASATLEFKPNPLPNTTDFIAELEIFVVDTPDGEDTDSGMITVQLNSQSNSQTIRGKYTLTGSSKTSGTVTIHDYDAPLISITNSVSDIYLGYSFNLEFSASIQPWQDQLSIRFNATTGDDFLAPNPNPTDPRSATVVFTDPGTGPSTGTLNITTMEDAQGTASGSIVITLVDDNNTPRFYKLDTMPGSTSTTIPVTKFTGPILSIHQSPDEFYEGEDVKVCDCRQCKSNDILRCRIYPIKCFR